MKKLIVTACAAIAAAFEVCGEVVTSGNNYAVSGDAGNTLALGEKAEALVTMEADAAATVSASSGATVIMKGSTLNLNGTNRARLFGNGAVAVGSGTAEIGGIFAGTVTIAEGAAVNFTDNKDVPTGPAKAAANKGTQNMLWYDPSRLDYLSYSHPEAATAQEKCLTIKNVSNTSWYPLCGDIRSAVVVTNAMANGAEMTWLYYSAKLGGYVQNEVEGYRGIMMRFQDGWSGSGNTFDTRTGFMVMDTTMGGGAFVVDTSVGGGTYLSGRTSASDPIFKPRTGHAGLAGADSPAYLNGVQVDSSKHAFNSRGEVLSFCFNEAVPLKNINLYTQSREKFHTRHGEVLFYNEVLTDAERQDTEAYLMNKWLGITPAGYGDPSSVTVDGEGAVTIAATRRPQFAATFAGAIDASAATALEFVCDDGVVTRPIRTTGALTLADSVSVKVEFKQYPAASGKLVLAKAGSITGGASLAIEVTSPIELTTKELAIEGNQLVLNYARPKELHWKASGVTIANADHAALVVLGGADGMEEIESNIALDTLTTTSLEDYKSGDYSFEILIYNASGLVIGSSPVYTYADLQAKVEGTAGVLTPESYAGYASGRYTLPCKAWSELGMDFGQQLTNAVTIAASGATIKILPGTHQLGNDYMYTVVTEDSGKTARSTVNSYVRANGKVLHFVGDTTGHWSGAVTLKGNGSARFYVYAASGDAKTTFEGLTFENFQAGDNPGVTTVANNSSLICGGAISGDMNLTATNCVFFNNRARTGGAIYNTTCRDCNFMTNSCSYNGGVSFQGGFYGCRFEGNHAPASGVHWGASGVDSCDYIGNYSNNGPAIFNFNSSGVKVYRNCRFINNYCITAEGICICSLGEGYVLSNSVFVGNHALGSGGAVRAQDGYSRNPAKVAKIIDCVFSNNYVGVNSSGNSNGGAIYAGNMAGYLWPPQIIGCKFVGNHSNMRGGAVYGGAISNCVFESNYVEGGTYSDSAMPSGGAVFGLGAGSNKTEIVDSTFVSNSINHAVYSKGAAIYMEATAAKCEQCRFYGNYLMNTNCTNDSYGKVIYSGRSGNEAVKVIDCAFTNNFVYRGGLVSNAMITNSIFSGNEVPVRGACAIKCEVYDSLFTNNRKDTQLRPEIARSNSGGWVIDVDGYESGIDALNSRLYHCDMDGGIFIGCSINECVIRKCCARGTWCVFAYGNAVTNTLITGLCSGPSMRAVIYRWGNATHRAARSAWVNEFVNCTFADNCYVGGQGTAKALLVCGYPQSSTNRTFSTKFLNCAFNNNRRADDNGLPNGEVVDLCAAVGRDANVDDAEFADIIVASNCVFGVAPKIVSNAGEAWRCDYTDLGGNRVIVAEEQKLVKTDAEIARFSTDSYKPAKYTPKGRSPLRGAGDASFYTAESKDAAGNLRVDGGKVDIGCYQSYLPRFGTLFMVK